MTSSASRCSSTIMARRRIARAPAAPGRTFTTPAMSRRASAFRTYVLDYESRFREKVIDDIRRELRQRRDARALRRLQSVHQIRRSVRDGEGPRRATRSRPAITSPRATTDAAAARSTAPRTPRATRAISCSRRRASSCEMLRFPLGDYAKAEVREHGPALRARGRREAGQPGHLLRAERPLHRRRRAPAPGVGGARRDRPCRRPRARPPRRRHPLHHRPAPRPRSRRRSRRPRRGAALRRAARRRQGAGRRRPARGAGDARACRCAT